MQKIHENGIRFKIRYSVFIIAPIIKTEYLIFLFNSTYLEKSFL